ncbi:NDP-sugar synthase [Halobacteriota archaeon]
MKTIILAGGLGTRLRKIISDKPKPMAQICGKPFLEWQIELLKRFNLRDIILSVGYMSNEIKNYFGNGKKFEVHIEYVEEEKPLGTGGALKNAESYVVNEDKFMVMNGDTYLLTDFTDFLSFHEEKKGLATISLANINEENHRYGAVEINEHCIITKFIEKSEKNFGSINTGAYVFDLDIYSYMPAKEVFSIEYDLFPKIVETNRIFGYKTNCYFRDLGTPEDYERIKKELEELIWS